MPSPAEIDEAMLALVHVMAEASKPPASPLGPIISIERVNIGEIEIGSIESPWVLTVIQAKDSTIGKAAVGEYKITPEEARAEVLRILGFVLITLAEMRTGQNIPDGRVEKLTAWLTRVSPTLLELGAKPVLRAFGIHAD